MPIIIDKDKARFFISINKIEGHSFVMLGVYDQHKVQHLLCRVGKFAVRDDEPSDDKAPVAQAPKNQEADGESSYEKAYECFLVLRFWYQALFSHAKSQLTDEGVFRRTRGLKAITYQAYDITYEQYLDFVRILEFLQTPKNKFKCYKPTEINGNEITLTCTDSISLDENSKAAQIKEHLCELTVGNTCRHSAIELVEQTRHAPVSSLVSHNFVTNLPYHTELEFGKPSEAIPFYVLPAPPSAYLGLNATQKGILTKLYTRLEQMLLLEPNSQSTLDKFESVKNLYNQIAGPKKPIALDVLLKDILDWKHEHASKISVMRQTFFWDSFIKRESATMHLITEVVHDVKRAQMG